MFYEDSPPVNPLPILKEECGYSITEEKVTFDRSQLGKCIIPKQPCHWNTKLGFNNYTPVVYGENDCKNEPFLQTYLNIKPIPNVGIFTPSSFYQYISVRRASKFYVLNHKGYFIIANTETRINQDRKMNYVGIRFEDLLIHGQHYKTVNNTSSFKVMYTTTVSDRLSIHFSEVDAYLNDPHDYVEIKMILCRGSIPSFNIKSNFKILLQLSRGNNYFDSFLFRLAIQCHYSSTKNVVIGIRDYSFNIRTIKQMSIERDILPFMKSMYPDKYKEYLKSFDHVTAVMNEILLKSSQSKMLSVTITSNEVKVEPHVYNRNIVASEKFINFLDSL